MVPEGDAPDVGNAWGGFARTVLDNLERLGRNDERFADGLNTLRIEVVQVTGSVVSLTQQSTQQGSRLDGLWDRLDDIRTKDLPQVVKDQALLAQSAALEAKHHARLLAAIPTLFAILAYVLPRPDFAGAARAGVERATYLQGPTQAGAPVAPTWPDSGRVDTVRAKR